jgi:hypothetical protein
MEPEKAEEWKWYDLNDPPSPLFEFCKLSFDAFKKGRKYYSSEHDF